MSAPASSELGQTQDPKKLVPGEVGTINANTEKLSAESRRIKAIQTQFDAVRTDGWVGGLGSISFTSSRSVESRKWGVYVDLLGKARSALTTYSGALGHAQGKAQEAITKWQQGEEATRSAVTAYNSAVETYNQSLLAPCPPSSPFGPVVPQMRQGPPGPFHDPGEALRTEARHILDEARKALDSAGTSALEELGALPGAKTEGDVDVLGASGNLEGPVISWTFFEKTFGTKDDGTDGEDSPFKISLGKAEGDVHVLKADGSVEDYWGNVKVNADGSVSVLGADGSAEATIDKEGVRINADGTVTLVGAEGTIHGELGPAELGITGTASVEATGEGHLDAGKDGVHAGGELFAGGRAAASGEGDVGGVGGKLDAEAQYGIGASGDVDVGMKDGKFTIGGHGGLAFGHGAKLGGEITIDVPEVIHSGGEITKSVDGLFH